MNSVVEKLAAIEKEVAAIQPKMAPLTQRIAALDQKVAGFAQQLAGVAEESASVKQDIELTQQCLARIQTLIGESKVESEQLVAGQEENLQRCETMTAVFGAAFQAMSQFFETAQRMGLADQAKAVFLTPPTATIPPVASIPDVSPVSAPPVVETAVEITSDLEAVLGVPVPDEPVIDAPVIETAPVMESALPEPPMMESPETEADSAANELPSVHEQVFDEPVFEAPVIDEPVVEAAPIIESPKPQPEVEPESEEKLEQFESEPMPVPIPESELESTLSEADFDSVMSSDQEAVSWGVSALPDVATPPEMGAIETDALAEADVLADVGASCEMASQLDVPPLELGIPALPEQGEPAPEDETDDDEIEAMLASMMTPVTATAGG